MATKENAPVVKESASLPSVIDFASDGGAGFENSDSMCYAIPFLRMLQAISPQAKKKDPQYIEGAEEGDFVNTVTEQLYKGDDGVIVVPCHFEHKYNKWAPDRGGFRGSLSATEYNNMRKETRTDSKGNQYEADAETGDQLSDTREHYVVIVEKNGSTTPALISLSGSELKKSKKWMSMMNAICRGGKIPMYSQMFKITPSQESNDKGSWVGHKIEHIGQVSSVEVYEAAKSFYKAVRSGAAKSSQEETSSEDL